MLSFLLSFEFAEEEAFDTVFVAAALDDAVSVVVDVDFCSALSGS